MANLLRGLSSADEYGFWTLSPQGKPVAVPPFVLSFSTTAMGGHALAAGDEEGIVSVLDTRCNLHQQMLQSTHPRFTAHENAIFDLSWLNGDRDIATASGDATIRVFDVETTTRRAMLRGHTGSAKAVRQCPSAPHLLLTAARDGNILGFDLRVPAPHHPFHGPIHTPVLTIARPHAPPVRYSMVQSVGRKRRRVQADGPPTARVGSVTSLAFSPTNHAQVFSAGASDGAVKLWDMRCLRPVATGGKQAAAGGGEDTPVACVVPGNELRRDDPYKTGRSHGIAGIDVDPTGRRLLVSSTDSSIYTYNASDIQLGYEKVLTGHSHTSFYIRACFSPDGNFVLSGSADSKAYIWDVQQRPTAGALTPILELAGHRGGEACAVDWCKTDMLKVATGADDTVTRVWTLDADRRADAADASEPTVHATVPAARPPVRRARPQARKTANARPGRLYREQDIRAFFTPATKPGALYRNSSPVSSCDGSEAESASDGQRTDAADTDEDDPDGEIMSLVG